MRTHILCMRISAISHSQALFCSVLYSCQAYCLKRLVGSYLHLISGICQDVCLWYFLKYYIDTKKPSQPLI
jgi:hypothetical protein